MDDVSGPPLRLLYQLEQGQITEDDLAILEAMLRAEGLENCPTPLRMHADRLALRHQSTTTHGNAPLENLMRRARLVFDSWHTPQLAAVRGPGSMPRQLLLQAQDAEIRLHVQPAGVNRIVLIGQVLGPDRSAGEATLFYPAVPLPDEVQADTPLVEKVAFGPVPVDDLGEFAFDRIQSGRYVLSLHLATERIDSVALDLGGQPDIDSSFSDG